ncbi:DUF6308 family protein [Arthrobacter sp. AG1021]|uniref:DUF6308 family protein n=1 Tax=Arthrobacter sp. AG1021 TaxID=2183908 RepID=UPI001C7D3DF2
MRRGESPANAEPRPAGKRGEAGQPQIDAIADLFGPLDEHRTPQVNPTTLAKMVQRKTPELIPLFERQVRRLICSATTNSGWK